MKKISFHFLSIILISLTLIAVFACGGDSKSDQKSSDKSNTSGFQIGNLKMDLVQ